MLRNTVSLYLSTLAVSQVKDGETWSRNVKDSTAVTDLLSKMLFSIATLQTFQSRRVGESESNQHPINEIVALSFLQEINSVAQRGICWKNKRIASGVEGCLKQSAHTLARAANSLTGFTVFVAWCHYLSLRRKAQKPNPSRQLLQLILVNDGLALHSPIHWCLTQRDSAASWKAS